MSIFEDLPGTPIAELTKWQRSLVEFTAGYLRKVALPACGPEEDPDVMLAMVNSAGAMSVAIIDAEIESGGLEVSPAIQKVIRETCAEQRPIIAGIITLAWQLYQRQDGSTPEALDSRRFTNRVYQHPDRQEVAHLIVLDPTGDPILVNAYWEIHRDGRTAPRLGRRFIIAEGVDRDGNDVTTKGFVPRFLAHAIADGLTGGRAS